MVEERITDGRRIAQLLASEIDGRDDGELDRLAVTNADRDVEPTSDGAHAYDITLTQTPGQPRTDERIARVFVHEAFARLAFETGSDSAVAASQDLDLRVEQDETAVQPLAVVSVESGAAVKRATTVVERVVRSAATDGIRG
ncbi:hypothetical protein [Natronoglomus mannanivorans]|uniref:DUF7993 domain-containing protein n=1 Tax=Natronoglomus mannanivorans TaxID=2979990 RepID=A0AAP2Z4U5_9EURY|nr:hypothetical protein [Halobacteria archaeon AArc-xg1-1]